MDCPNIHDKLNENILRIIISTIINIVSMSISIYSATESIEKSILINFISQLGIKYRKILNNLKYNLLLLFCK